MHGCTVSATSALIANAKCKFPGVGLGCACDRDAVGRRVLDGAQGDSCAGTAAWVLGAACTWLILLYGCCVRCEGASLSHCEGAGAVLNENMIVRGQGHCLPYWSGAEELTGVDAMWHVVTGGTGNLTKTGSIASPVCSQGWGLKQPRTQSSARISLYDDTRRSKDPKMTGSLLLVTTLQTLDGHQRCVTQLHRL